MEPQRTVLCRSQPVVGSRILVVEDDADSGNLLLEALSVEGYQVQLVADGSRTFDALAQFCPDLLLLDVMMPNLDGLEICRRVRGQESSRFLPILFLTAKDDLSDKIEGFQAGGDDYITKPFTISELLARIKSHLRIQHLKNELALSEERYRLLIESSPDGIILLSPHLELLFHNSRFFELLNGSVEKPLVGKTLHALTPLSNVFVEISGIVDSVKSTNALCQKEARISASNHRTIHLEIVGMPVKTEFAKVAMFQVVLRDITDRKRIEEALLQTEKINALGTLTSGIAHEINNPLTCVSNAIQILQRRTGNRERQEELFSHILEQIERIAGIVKDLRVFSQPHESVPILFSANEAVAEMAKLAKYQILRQKVTLGVHTSEEGLFLFGDRYQFQQVILNLVVNAIQAIKDEGEVNVRVERKGNSALITVDDTGIGIPANQMGRIFDPFFTTKHDWKGTGLGLAVSYRIVQLFRGTLTVQSTVGSGSRFMVTVPLSPPSNQKMKPS